MKNEETNKLIDTITKLLTRQICNFANEHGKNYEEKIHLSMNIGMNVFGNLALISLPVYEMELFDLCEKNSIELIKEWFDGVRFSYEENILKNKDGLH